MMARIETKSAKTRLLYEVDYAREGKNTQPEMSAALDQWLKGLQVHER